ncbi:uncharacterized protein EDB91DRAFT_1326886 [Suillus paluster]|uniref:uncharacterized protein n=1 Tax=Suillus paluster TaxID=48578 RepID=UPI001B86918D|nr:uncharacterized protein EDB91DRAFT_1326886 [Suillus paluster]KAG1751487.1 hypothetical protein EDB91DRAFT_1326886 [Suillus paluster]
MPLHRLKMWCDEYFHPIMLKQLRFACTTQSQHWSALLQPQPKPAYNNDFTVIDVHGIHEATSTDPRTAATFTVLEHFHLLSFESKVSAFEFYHCIARRSDNTGVNPIKDCYSIFLRIMAEWQQHQSTQTPGVDATQEGELIVLCPACPHPGKNLAETLTDVTPGNQVSFHHLLVSAIWIYSLFLAIDANFRLKRWGYFVEERNYKAYLQENGTLTQEKSTCVSHNAVNMADMKASKGLAATANGVGDLQKGEKYLNMDYIVFSVLSHFLSIPAINFSYDITCQWHKKLWHRVSAVSSLTDFIPTCSQQYRFFIPKFHLAAHIAACQTEFSFNWSPHVGRTDGEAPGAGAGLTSIVRDILDDHFGDWNWKKVTALGRTLLHKIKDAVDTERDHHHALADLEGSIKESGLRCCVTCSLDEGDCCLGERSHQSQTPSTVKAEVSPEFLQYDYYLIGIPEVTQAAVRLALVQQDVKDLEEGTSISLHSEVTPSILISTGLDLEDAQRRLRVDSANLTQHSTNDQRTKILTRSNSLQRCIDSWIMVQVLYMPFISHIRATTSGCPKAKPDSIKPEDILLLLPSDICNRMACDTKLLQVEWSLHLAQANDALNECHSHVHLHHQLLRFKAQHIRGQGANTRAQKSIQAVECRLILSHEKYSRARQALVHLSAHLGYLGWEHKLQPLRKSDLRPMGDLGGRTQGTAIMPWIWLTHGISADDSDGLQDSLHIEWCKTRARHNRWFEEIQLLLEEMRRVMEFLAWQAKWWDERTTLRVAERSADVEGLAAYAKRQAAIRRSLAARFRALWGNVPTLIDQYALVLVPR